MPFDHPNIVVFEVSTFTWKRFHIVMLGTEIKVDIVLQELHFYLEKTGQNRFLRILVMLIWYGLVYKSIFRLTRQSHQFIEFIFVAKNCSGSFSLCLNFILTKLLLMYRSTLDFYDQKIINLSNEELPLSFYCSVGWGFRIHRPLLCRGVRLPLMI